MDAYKSKALAGEAVCELGKVKVSFSAAKREGGGKEGGPWWLC